MWDWPWVAKSWRIEYIILRNSPCMVFINPTVLHCSCRLWSLKILCLIPSISCSHVICLGLCSLQPTLCLHPRIAINSAMNVSWEGLWSSLVTSHCFSHFRMTISYYNVRRLHTSIEHGLSSWVSKCFCDSKGMLKSGNTTRYHE